MKPRGIYYFDLLHRQSLNVGLSFKLVGDKLRNYIFKKSFIQIQSQNVNKYSYSFVISGFGENISDNIHWQIGIRTYWNEIKNSVRRNDFHLLPNCGRKVRVKSVTT